MNIIDSVRAIVGRRARITRDEMRRILCAVPNLPENSTITSRDSSGVLHAGRRRVEPDEDETQITALVWERCCRGITVISILGGHVRYDEPGSMHPMQVADISFCPEDLRQYDHDPIGYLRRHARRVLIVIGEPSTDPVPAPQPGPPWIGRLRHPRLDGLWNRVLLDGTLEMRDPNDGQSGDIQDKVRHQYRVTPYGEIQRRVLPPESIGDAWEDIGIPEWEDRTGWRHDDLVVAWVTVQFE